MKKLTVKIISLFSAAIMTTSVFPINAAAVPRINDNVYEAFEEAFKEGKDTVNVCIEFNEPDEAMISAQVMRDTDEYLATLGEENYSHHELENIRVNYYRKRGNALIKMANVETVKGIVDKLGLKEEEYNHNSNSIIPLMNADITAEQLEIAAEIEEIESIGIIIPPDPPLGVQEEPTFGWDLYSTAKGDVNSDFDVNIADAVKLLQFIANSNKYPLTEQEKINADVDGNPGITGLDVLLIQKMAVNSVK